MHRLKNLDMPSLPSTTAASPLVVYDVQTLASTVGAISSLYQGQHVGECGRAGGSSRRKGRHGEELAPTVEARVSMSRRQNYNLVWHTRANRFSATGALLVACLKDDRQGD